MPVTPYSSETPKSMTAVDTTETRNSFTAASAPLPSYRRRAVNAKTGSETSSSDTTSMIRSRDAGSSTAPVRVLSSRRYHSPAGTRRSDNSAIDNRTTTIPAASITPAKISEKWSATNEHNAEDSTPDGTGPARSPGMQKVSRSRPHPAWPMTNPKATTTPSKATRSRTHDLRPGPRSGADPSPWPSSIDRSRGRRTSSTRTRPAVNTSVSTGASAT